MDLIIGKKMAIEIKISKQFRIEFAEGLLALREENLIAGYLVVGRFVASGTYQGVTYMGYQEFLNKFWNDRFAIP